MSTFQVGRILLAPPLQIYEQVGDPVTNTGGAIVPAIRTALRHAVSLGTFAADGQDDSLAGRLVLRRQLRSLLNNTPYKLQGFCYVQYSDDPEHNGWYIPDQGQFADIEAASGLATGAWKLDNVNWAIVGHLRTNREARNIWIKDLRTGLYPRDTLRIILLTDFSLLTALSLSVFPHGAAGMTNTVTLMRPLTTTLPTGRDGGVCTLITGLLDLSCLSYDRAESALNLSDVVCYDRRGQITAPTTGADTSWNEVYGADWPWNWLTIGQPQDTPVLDNGLVRIRYDASVGGPGFRIDTWNGTAYVEQGKATFQRNGDTTGYDDTFISAGLHTDNSYTPERSIMTLVLTRGADPYSRERIFVTLTRGNQGCTIECYPAPTANGTPADALITWTPVVNALNASVMKVDSQTTQAAGNGKIVATAGTASALLSPGPVGNVTFASSENYLALLSYSAAAVLRPFQHNIGVVQQYAQAYVNGSDTSAYGAAGNGVGVGGVGGTGLGYASLDLAFTPVSAAQALEAEAMTLATGTSSASDGSSSGGTTTTATRTADALHISAGSWPNSAIGRFRAFVRVKVSAGTGSFYGKTPGLTAGATVTTTSTSYVWLDLGELRAQSSTLEIHAWVSTGTVYVDRVEAFQTENTTTYSGARNFGQSILVDSRTLGAVVSR